MPNPQMIEGGSAKLERPQWWSWKGASYYLQQIYLRGLNGDALRQHEAAVLRDLQEFIEHVPHAVNYIMDVRNWRLDALIARDTRIAKPRIELDLDITTKGNLTLRWYPLGEHEGFYRGQDARKTDFNESVAMLADNLYAGQRPDNELLFVHDFRQLHYDLTDRTEQRPVSCLLVFAVFAAGQQWPEFLHYSFEITKRTWFELDFEKEKLVGWKFYDVKERNIQTEFEWIRGFETEHGISPERFLSIHSEFQGWDKHAKISKKLKEQGIKLTPTTVRKVAERIKERHGVIWMKARIGDDVP